VAPLVIWGASGHAKVLAEFLTPPEHEIVALFDNDATVESPLPRVPVFHGAEGFKQWRAEHPRMLPGACVAIGGERGRDRVELQRFLARHGCAPIVAVHPTAFVARTARVGAGSHVLANAALAADAVVGEACILNTAASVDHECVLADGVHVAPNATLAGLVTVGPHTLIGTGAIVLPRVSVGADVVVGAGAVVTRDVPDGAVVVGNPARPHTHR
jgi:sugar O-acyltransferase (sialic acid O-acetyltransferase NeuD family)